MNTTTFDARYTEATGKTRKAGFFARLFEQFLAAREAEARRRIAIHFSHVSDRQLAEMGMGARDIELIRAGQAVRFDLAG